MDKIFIRRLKVPAHIGTYPHEKIATQPVFIDVVIRTDIKQAADKDALEKTIDYSAVRESIIQFLALQRFALLETLAEKLATFLMETFQLLWLRLTIRKPQAFLDAEEVGVSIERQGLP